MARKRTQASPDGSVDLDAALFALDEDALRGLVRELLALAEERLHEEILDRLIQRAAGNEAG